MQNKPLPETLKDAIGTIGDLSVFGFFDEIDTIRADYAWMKYCDELPIENLRLIVEDGAFGHDSDTGDALTDEDHGPNAAFYKNRHKQAIAILKERESRDVKIYPPTPENIETLFRRRK